MMVGNIGANPDNATQQIKRVWKQTPSPKLQRDDGTPLFPAEYQRLRGGSATGFARGHQVFWNILGTEIGHGILIGPDDEPRCAILVNALGSNNVRPGLKTYHAGFDFAVKIDTKLLAPADGVVVVGGADADICWHGENGEWLGFSHVLRPKELMKGLQKKRSNNRVITWKQVKKGDVIAALKSKYWATPHYHINGNLAGYRVLDPRICSALDKLPLESKIEICQRDCRLKEDLDRLKKIQQKTGSRKPLPCMEQEKDIFEK